MMEAKSWITKPDTMRIAFSGSAGIGKTTLANAVNEHLNFTMLTEGVREWMKENKVNDIHTLEGRRLMKFQMDILNRSLISEAKHKQFIADRTTLDRMCYALFYLSKEEEFQRGLMHYVEDCTTHALQTYDVIFLLPYGRFPLEDDKVRKPYPAYQFMFQMMIEYAVGLGAGVYHVHMVQSDSIEDRTQEVLSVIDDMTRMKIEHSEKKSAHAKRITNKQDEVGDIIQRVKVAPRMVQ